VNSCAASRCCIAKFSLFVVCGYAADNLVGATAAVHASNPIRSPFAGVGPEGDPIRKIRRAGPPPVGEPLQPTYARRFSRQRWVFCRRLNKLIRTVLSIMTKNKPTTGPMSTQPVRCPEIPMISSVGKVTRAPQPAQKSTKTEAISVEKARITRLNSLREQREALKR
jgi:hypothetical protein